MLTEYQTEFIRLLREVSRSKHDFEIFNDFVMMASASLHNGARFSKELEDRYMAIAKNYSKEQLITFSHMLACVVSGLEQRHQDFLGEVYMALELGNAKTGQFFTPYCVSKLMAEVTVGGSNWKEVLKHKEVITVSEPACGTGGMMIAISEVLKNDGCVYHDHLWISAIDIDEVVAMACYIQLSLLGIAAEVIVGNALSLEYRYVMKTPFHYFKFFDVKLRAAEATSAPLSEAQAAEEIDVIKQKTEQIVFDF